MKHLLLTAFVSSILFLVVTELQRRDSVGKIGSEASLMGQLPQSLKKDKLKLATGRQVVESLEKAIEQDQDWLADTATQSMDHKELENLRDWVDFFAGLAKEKYVPLGEKVFVGKNTQGFEQYMFINGKNERVLQWFDEEGLSVEELLDSEQSIARFYGYSSGKVDLVKVAKGEDTVSFEFDQRGYPKYLWVNSDKGTDKTSLFFHFHSDGRMKTRFYKSGKRDWQECEHGNKLCQMPKFQ